MLCEVCGSRVEKFYHVLIEGSKLKACKPCTKFGKIIENKTNLTISKKFKPTPLNNKKYDTISGYGTIIRKTRENLRLTQKEFANKIQEKASIIIRLESERMNPSKKLAKKIETTFGITLFSSEEDPGYTSELHDKSDEITITDVLKIKKN